MTELNIIDFEASSLSGRSYPIQVGVVMNDGREYMAYIKPISKWIDWNPLSEKIHNISRDYIESYGEEAINVAHELNNLIGTDTVFCDGGVYDFHWCNALYNGVNIKRTWSIESITVEDLFVETHWNLYMNHYAKELGFTEHDALHDAKLIQYLTKLARSKMLSPPPILK